MVSPPSYVQTPNVDWVTQKRQRRWKTNCEGPPYPSNTRDVTHFQSWISWGWLSASLLLTQWGAKVASQPLIKGLHPWTVRAAQVTELSILDCTDQLARQAIIVGPKRGIVFIVPPFSFLQSSLTNAYFPAPNVLFVPLWNILRGSEGKCLYQRYMLQW